MGRYADYDPTVEYPTPPRWSDNLEAGTLHAELKVRLVADAKEWARDHGVPLDQASEAFSKWVIEQTYQAWPGAMPGGSEVSYGLK